MRIIDPSSSLEVRESLVRLGINNVLSEHGHTSCTDRKLQQLNLNVYFIFQWFRLNLFKKKIF